MPWWNREILVRRDVAAGVLPANVDSDPEAFGDGRYADQISGFLEIEYIKPGFAVDVYRWGGPAADLLKAIDATPYLSASLVNVYRIVWPEPPPAFVMTRLTIRRTSGVGPAEVTLRLVQTCRLEA